MDDSNFTADQGNFESFENDEDDFDEDDDEGLINVLDELEIKNHVSRSYKGLDAVIFDDEIEDEELLNLCRSSTEENSQALVLHEESGQEDEADIDSDEERDILKGIREDIEMKVREEMQEELKGYQQRMKAIEEGRLPGKTDDEKNNDVTIDEDEEMTPQLKDAILKMNKLDKILRKKVKREKEVKRDRILLERRMRQEISEMEHGASNYREIKMNTEKFLALAPPPSHNEGVSLEPEDGEEMPPLFQTQIDESELDRRKKGRETSDRGSQNSNQPRSGSSISSQGTRSRASRSGANFGSQPCNKARKKDFIKRNKELASEADQPVAMTDDEKRRLQSLLEGVDELPEIEEGDNIASLMDLNPFQISVQPGEGFCPDSSESRTLSSIDQRLKGLMPEEDFRAIFTAGGPGSVGARDSIGATPSQPLFTRVGLHSTGNDAAALERFGERVLYETKEERELKARLLAIENQLELFKTPQEMEDEPAGDCHLSDQQLDELLDQCARNMSHTIDAETPESTPRSQLSSRQSLLANPPRLTDEQLQQLLSDAQFPLSSRLLALRDDDQKIEEEDGSIEMIRAETWIAIRDAKLDEDIGAVAGETTQTGASKDAGKNSPTDLKPDHMLKPLKSLEVNSSQRETKPDDSARSKNLSTNNAYHTETAGASSRADLVESREIDDFAFTPDITNPTCISNGNAQPVRSSPPSHPSRHGREKEVRGSSGGARAKSGSVEFPRLPHPPQLSTASSIRTSVDSDATMRLEASSLVCSSNESFDSFVSGPSNNNNNGAQDGVQHPVRLPEISPSSFLIHTPQGMNNDERTQPRSASRPILQMVRNSLSDMSVTSMSVSDREENAMSAAQTPQASPAGQKNSNASAGHRVPQHSLIRQPAPPAVKKQT